MAKLFVKDPDAELDYSFDWSDYLATGETISSQTMTVESGLTLGTGEKAPSESDGIVVFWLSGGPAGEDYDVACKIVTSASRTDERTMTIRVKNR